MDENPFSAGGNEPKPASKPREWTAFYRAKVCAVACGIVIPIAVLIGLLSLAYEEEQITVVGVLQEYWLFVPLSGIMSAAMGWIVAFTMLIHFPSRRPRR